MTHILRPALVLFVLLSALTGNLRGLAVGLNAVAEEKAKEGAA